MSRTLNRRTGVLIVTVVALVFGCQGGEQVASLRALEVGTTHLKAGRAAEALGACRRSYEAQAGRDALLCWLGAALEEEDWSEAAAAVTVLADQSPNEGWVNALEVEVRRRSSLSLGQGVRVPSPATAWSALDGTVQWPEGEIELANWAQGEREMLALVLARSGRIEESQILLKQVEGTAGLAIRLLLQVITGDLKKMEQSLTREGMGGDDPMLDELELFVGMSGEAQRQKRVNRWKAELKGGDTEPLSRKDWINRLATRHPGVAAYQINAAFAAIENGDTTLARHFAERAVTLNAPSRVAAMTRLLVCLASPGCDFSSDVRSNWVRTLDEKWRRFLKLLINL